MQGLVQTNSLSGLKLIMQDQEMQHCQENISSYNHIVIGEYMDECVHSYEKDPIEEITWEPKRDIRAKD